MIAFLLIVSNQVRLPVSEVSVRMIAQTENARADTVVACRIGAMMQLH